MPGPQCFARSASSDDTRRPWPWLTIDTVTWGAFLGDEAYSCIKTGFRNEFSRSDEPPGPTKSKWDNLQIKIVFMQHEISLPQAPDGV